MIKYILALIHLSTGTNDSEGAFPDFGDIGVNGSRITHILRSYRNEHSSLALWHKVEYTRPIIFQL